MPNEIVSRIFNRPKFKSESKSHLLLPTFFSPDIGQLFPAREMFLHMWGTTSNLNVKQHLFTTIHHSHTTLASGRILIGCRGIGMHSDWLPEFDVPRTGEYRCWQVLYMFIYRCVTFRSSHLDSWCSQSPLRFLGEPLP